MSTNRDEARRHADALIEEALAKLRLANSMLVSANEPFFGVLDLIEHSMQFATRARNAIKETA
jgi:hypothetical protein